MLDLNLSCLPKMNLNLLFFNKTKKPKEFKKLIKELPNVLIVEETSKPYPFSLNLEKMKVYVVNTDLVYQYATDVDELHIKANDMINKKVCDVLPREYGEFFQRIYRYVLDSSKTIRIHVIIDKTHYLLIANPLKNGGNIGGVLLIRIPYSTIEMLPLSIISVDV
jgi:hypothetical protein